MSASIAPSGNLKWPGLKGLLESTTKLTPDMKKYIIYTIVAKFNYAEQKKPGFNPDNISEHQILLHNLKEIKRLSGNKTYADKYSKVINALLLDDTGKKGGKPASGMSSESGDDNAGGIMGFTKQAKKSVMRAVTFAETIPSRAISMATSAVLGKSKAPEYMALIAAMHNTLTTSGSTGNYDTLLNMVTSNTGLTPVPDFKNYDYTTAALYKPTLPASWENYYRFTIATLNIAGCEESPVNKFLESVTIKQTKTPATDLILIQGAPDKFKASGAITSSRGDDKSYVAKKTENIITLYDHNAINILDNYKLEGKYQGKTWTASYSDKDKLVIINFESGVNFNIAQFEQQVLAKINKYTNIPQRLKAGYKLLIAGTFTDVDAENRTKLLDLLSTYELTNGLNLKIAYPSTDTTDSQYIITNVDFTFTKTETVCSSSKAVMGKLEYFLDETKVKEPTGEDIEPGDVDKKDSSSSNKPTKAKSGATKSKASDKFTFADLLTDITNQYNQLTEDAKQAISKARKLYSDEEINAIKAEQKAADERMKAAREAEEARKKAEDERKKGEETDKQVEATKKKAVEDYEARKININGTEIIVPISINVTDRVDLRDYNMQSTNLYANSQYIQIDKPLPTTAVKVNDIDYDIRWTHRDESNNLICGSFSYQYTNKRKVSNTAVVLVAYNGSLFGFMEKNNNKWIPFKYDYKLPESPPAPAPTDVATALPTTPDTTAPPTTLAHDPTANAQPYDEPL